jgi:hypothetical protein
MLIILLHDLVVDIQFISNISSLQIRNDLDLIDVAHRISSFDEILIYERLHSLIYRLADSDYLAFVAELGETCPTVI